MIHNGKKFLVTTDNWFQAPDGENYRAAWGACVLLRTQDIFGFSPQKPSTNWFLKIGSEDKFIIVAGCQIHFVVRCEERPTMKEGTCTDKNTGSMCPENRIYFAE
jgi:hypothetical protein